MPEILEYKIGIGRDRYNRIVEMFRHKEGGRWYWRIVRQPSSQRDDGNHAFYDLTDENIREMVEALDCIKRGR